MVYMCSLSFSVFDGSTNCLLSRFPHTTALEDLAGHFLNRKVVAGGGSLASSDDGSLNSAFLVVCFIIFWVFIPLNFLAVIDRDRIPLLACKKPVY